MPATLSGYLATARVAEPRMELYELDVSDICRENSPKKTIAMDRVHLVIGYQELEKLGNNNEHIIYEDLFFFKQTRSDYNTEI